MRIGLDFDNTIIRYDAVFVAAARERGLLPEGFAGSKQQVRDAIRLRPDGETEWQTLQGHVYGAGIGRAEMFPGLDLFLSAARRNGDMVLIVSHKTEYGHYDPARVNLRLAALGWMEAHGFFDPRRFAIGRENVHFGATRAEKLARIAEARCDVFIDDLEEVLDDPDFPEGPRRILFSDRARPGAPYPAFGSWAALMEAVFGVDA